MQKSLISKRHYLILGLYSWCVDNNLTPYIIIKNSKKANLPSSSIKNDEAVFNIESSAITNLIIDKHAISFQALFNGVKKEVYAPIGNVIACFAQEISDGMMFEFEETQSTEDLKPKSKLSIIK